MNKLINKNRVTCLLVFSILLITIFPIIFVFHKTISQDPYGLKFIVMIVFVIIGIIGIFIDYLFFVIIKNKRILNLVELFLIIYFLYIFWPR